MISCLFVLLNKVFLNDLELLYGKGSYVDVLSVKYCTNNNHYLLDCKLYVSDLSSVDSVGVGGLNFLVEECWKFTGFSNYKVAVLSTIDLVHSS